MTVIPAKDITLTEVHKLLKLQQQWTNGVLTNKLTLEPLTEYEQQEILQIRTDFRAYIYTEKVSEGMVKALTTFPLIRLAGFYHYPIKISLEQDIADIIIKDEDTTISGRYDLLAINKEQSLTEEIFFWVLVIEAKNSGITTYMGLPQLLTYAYQSLAYQESVWGLVTNGIHYQFVHLQQGNPPTYQLMPELNLLDNEDYVLLLQALKAICK